MIPVMRAAYRSAYRTIIVICGSQMSKALALDTLIATPRGWTTMGALAPGDTVFDERGAPTKVTAVSPVYATHQCYEVVFCDGSTITADAGHKWEVIERKRFRNAVGAEYAVPTPRVATTRELVEAGVTKANGAARFAVKLTEPLVLPEQELPIHPYILGMWLGDGHSYSGAIYYHESDLEFVDHLKNSGAEFNRIGPTNTNRTMHRAIVTELAPKLRAAGLLENTHIPAQYLRASNEQRMELLQGLLDTDGSVLKGVITFTSKHERLAAQVCELAVSLGFRPRLVRRTLKSGRFIGYEFWSVRFFAYSDQPVFKLTWNLRRLPCRDAPTSRPSQNTRRYIHEIREVESVPVRCIAVDSPSHLFLAGRGMIPTHNSESLFNIAGHRLSDDPVPVLYIGPTRSNVEKVMEPRFMQMVRQSTSMRKLYTPGKHNSKTRKILGGTTFRFAWAGSATELAADPAGVVFLDERDRMSNVQGEGDPMELGDARRMTYADSILIGTSTPTEGNVEAEWDEETKLERWKTADPEDIASPIWKRWQEGTRFEWAVPCPHCAEFFIPRFSLLKWKEDSTPNDALHNAQLMCRRCAALIDDSCKTDMNARGVYVGPGQHITPDGTVHGPVIATDTATFWISGLCSPWQTFGQRAKKFLAAVHSKDPARVQAAVNTDMGELFRTSGAVPAWEQVYACHQPYKKLQVPEGAFILIMSVDVQKNRLVYVIRAWGAGMTSWLVDYGEIFGETEYDPVWSQLGVFRNARMGDFQITGCFIDSGYRPGDKDRRPDNQIYKFCRNNAGWAYATKSHDTQDKPLKMAKIDITLDGKTLEGGLQLWHVNSDHYKSWIHGRITWPMGEVGGWYLPEDVTEAYCRQIVAEARVVKPSGHIVWVRLHKENHFLDVEMLSVAAADFFKVWALTKPITSQTERADRLRKAGAALNG